MKKLSGLLLFAGFVSTQQAAAQAAFREGSPVTAPSNCASGGDLSFWSGYVIDPSAGIPVLGGEFLVHGMVFSRATCPTGVGIDLVLPPNARLGTAGVRCFQTLADGRVVNLSADAGFCFQSPMAGTQGALRFGATAMARDQFFEVQVPIIFDGPVDYQVLSTRISTSAHAPGQFTPSMVLADVPFQPAPSDSARGDDLVLVGAAAGGGMGVAFSNDDGSFNATNRLADFFPSVAQDPNARRISGDFDGDGLVDFAMIGGPGWNTIPVARSNGDGAFTSTNSFVGAFGSLFGAPEAKVLTGDFNGDHRTDIALVGGSTWSTIPVAFSNGDGSFTVTNNGVSTVPQMAALPGAKPLVGDFNKDGLADIIVVGAQGRSDIWIAYSRRDGTFNLTVTTPSFLFLGGPALVSLNPLANEAGAQAVVGDFNGDGWSDVAIVGSSIRRGIFIATNIGGGQLVVSRQDVETGFPMGATFSDWSRTPGAKLLVGDYNRDGFPDFALTGGAGWNTLPVAMNSGGRCRACASFTITNIPVPGFGDWAQISQPVAGDFNGDGMTDIALVGGAGWGSVPIAESVGSGLFAIRNATTARFPAWASTPVRVGRPTRGGYSLLYPTAFAGKVNY